MNFEVIVISPGAMMKQSMTVAESMTHLLGRNIRACPTWPPDVFAVCGSVLRDTGAYVACVDGSGCPTCELTGRKDWPIKCRSIAEKWRKKLDKFQVSGASYDDIATLRPPTEVASRWRELVALARELRLNDLRMPAQSQHMTDDAVRCIALLAELVLICDEACAGLGVNQASTGFLRLADVYLTQYSQGSSQNACREVWTDRACVLPKQHTPQLGLSFRSLTHHLALLPRADVTVSWTAYERTAEPESSGLANILVLPWPVVTDPVCFMPQAAHSWSHAQFGFFHYEVSRPLKELMTYVEHHLAQATAACGKIDIVILPELALTWEAFIEVQRACHEYGAILVAGVGMTPVQASPGSLATQAHNYPEPTNTAAIAAPLPPSQGANFQSAEPALWLFQRKHHRWQLEWSQIRSYGLGAVLPAHQRLWEHTALGPREIQFFKMDDWLTLCPLICEDLARQDPMSSVLRAVGPNLVIALLMDGPQLRGRWPSRYASVLADDPGSSVLTVTSLGMSLLSKPREPGRVSRARAVALWRDPVTGEHELELPEGHDALVLCLARHAGTEWTSDGRSDGGNAFTPTLVNVVHLPTPFEDSSPSGRPA